MMLDVREPQLLGGGVLFIFRVHPQWTGISNSSAARRHKEINPTETAPGEKVGSLQPKDGLAGNKVAAQKQDESSPLLTQLHRVSAQLRFSDGFLLCCCAQRHFGSVAL